MFYITTDCVSCNNCATECPMQAIYRNGLKYEIDTEKCVECGLCEKVCHTGACRCDEAPQYREHDTIHRCCDLIVCGGGSGLVTAVRAAQQGKKVILLEKSSKLGGNMDFAHMFFPVYSVMHQEMGLPDLREEAIEEYYRRGQGLFDKEMIRAAVYGTGYFFDWLCEFPATRETFSLAPLGEMLAFGPFYGNALIHYPERMYDSLNTRDQAIGPGWPGTFIKYEMLKAIKDQGLDVEILMEHEAKHIMLDENGTVSGIIAQDPGGETVVHAPAAVLATGGFGKSDEKLKRYFPEFFAGQTPIHRFSVPTDTGDGITMLQEIGVEPDEEQMFVSVFGPAHHPYSYSILRILEHPSCVSVNLNGKRWHNEELGLSGDRISIASQPKQIAWGIFSRENAEMVNQFYLNSPAFGDEHWVYETTMEELDEECEYKTPAVYKGDTLEELAEKLGIDKESFVDTIRTYNKYCESGVDEEFGKRTENLIPIGDGPYYAIYGQRFSEGAFGGLRVTPNCEVTREDGTIIPGLYGGGDATSAVERRRLISVIGELTWALASAYICSKNVVNYLDSHRKEK